MLPSMRAQPADSVCVDPLTLSVRLLPIDSMNTLIVINYDF